LTVLVGVSVRDSLAAGHTGFSGMLA